jgi:CxxC motif-containing protein
VSVKTAEPVPKHLVLDIMDTLAVVQAKGLVNAGDVIVADVLGTGVNIIATSNSD